MKSLIEVWNALEPFLSTQTLAAIVIVALAFKAKEVINKFLERTSAARKALEERLTLVEFRQAKMMAIMVDCPTVTRNNLAWLKDDKRNDKPPEKSTCALSPCTSHKDAMLRQKAAALYD